MHTVVELKNYQVEAESLLSSEERRHIIITWRQTLRLA